MGKELGTETNSRCIENIYEFSSIVLICQITNDFSEKYYSVLQMSEWKFCVWMPRVADK